MITISKLRDNFYPVDEIGDGFVRCADELPETTYYTYFMICDPPGYHPFVVSENRIDDDFAGLVLTANACKGVSSLTKVELAQNSYGFSHVLFVPFQYHAELKGRLDSDRDMTTLCIPIFNSEFSGTETPEEFVRLRRNIVATSRWDRELTPKIALRFDNGKTKGGTRDGYVFSRFDQVLGEVDDLVGVSDGFIEVINYRGDVVEILFSKGIDFSWIRGRDDSRSERISKDAIRSRLWAFLTQ